MIKEKIYSIIAELMNMDISVISDETTLTDLGADSVDIFQIAAMLEDAFDVELPATAHSKIITVSDCCEYIKTAIS